MFLYALLIIYPQSPLAIPLYIYVLQICVLQYACCCMRVEVCICIHYSSFFLNLSGNTGVYIYMLQYVYVAVRVLQYVSVYITY